jgi:ATP-dependent DNA helicase RecG
LTSLPGVGRKFAALLETAAGGAHVVDLLWHLPNGVIDRRFSPKVSEAPEGVLVTLTVRVDAHVAPRNRRAGGAPSARRQPYKVWASDETGRIGLVFFNARAEYLERVLPVGQLCVVSGTAERYGGELQMTHPDHIGPVEELERMRAVEPTYRLTAGLPQSTTQKAVRAALERAPALAEWHDAALLAREGWVAWRDALQTAHTPESEIELSPTTLARRRLAYDELLANQLALLLVRRRLRLRPGRAIHGNGRLRKQVLSALPYRLTGAQERSLRGILADMERPNRMLRLLQGDVGSGKTVVALLAMLAAVESGAQAALMAPTELLARQHLRTISALAEPAGVRVGLLTGGRGKDRQDIVDRIAAGGLDIVIGTHALFQEGIAFRDLAFVVVDEQHRFGVHQRLALTDQVSTAADVLVMSATPIPRTLTLTVFGDMDVSRLDEKPHGRRAVVTRALPLARLDEVVAAVGRRIAQGERAYWVCPLVSESEALDAAAAEERFAALAEKFGEKVGLAHGRQKSAERDRVMARFAAGEVRILVATTVIEVGVDVPEATIMVIEHAERFGLAQLHQLRGRVGRGGSESSCLLLYAPPLGEAARARIGILRETDDGFRIAEEDLRLRGAGEILGVRQSGLPQFRVADLAAHQDLLSVARDDAQAFLQQDPELRSPRGQALRTLLYLFERDAATGLVRSG